jgi:TolB-like protein
MYVLGIAGLAEAAAIAFAVIKRARPPERRIAVAHFENETGDPAFDRFAVTLTDTLVASLTAQTSGRFGVIGNAAILRRSRRFQDLDEIAAALNAEYVIIGQVQRDGQRFRVLAHLIRMPAKTHVKVIRREIDSATGETRSGEQIASDLVGLLNSSPPANK